MVERIDRQQLLSLVEEGTYKLLMFSLNRNSQQPTFPVRRTSY